METHRVNVLLVDDQPANLLALEEILRTLPFNLELVRAESGPEALRHLLVQDFAVILLDVLMPVMDGFETAMLIRERDRSRHIPIIFLTAVGNSELHVSTGYSVGAVDYLFKPVVPDILRAKVATFIELFQKTEEVKRQAQILHELEQREHERRVREMEDEWQTAKLIGTLSAIKRGQFSDTKRNVTMSEVTDQVFDEIDFTYSPELQPTAEQRIEVLECQVADLREQLISVREQICDLPMVGDCDQPVRVNG